MKTGAISIYESNLNAARLELILAGLLSDGWSANKSGQIVYVMDESYELLSKPFNDGNLTTVKQFLFENINNNLPASLDLVYKNNGAVIGLHFLNDVDGKRIMITIPENIVSIEGLEIPDFSWYINSIKAVFNYIKFYRVTCNFD